MKLFKQINDIAMLKKYLLKCSHENERNVTRNSIQFCPTLNTYINCFLMERRKWGRLLGLKHNGLLQLAVDVKYINLRYDWTYVFAFFGSICYPGWCVAMRTKIFLINSEVRYKIKADECDSNEIRIMFTYFILYSWIRCYSYTNIYSTTSSLSLCWENKQELKKIK